MLSPVSKSGVKAVIVVLILIEAFLQVRIDPGRKQFEPGGDNVGRATKGLPIEFAVGALVGFREAVAGLLWVRTDEFFHSGDYSAITPMVRIITWLDPHQIDVYETGAWHMDYNFTDFQQRSDRRYIPLSIALLKEGIDNNPNTPSLVSDLAFVHYYRKVEDYAAAKEWYLKGQKRIDEMIAASAKDPSNQALKEDAKNARLAVTSLSHGLAHAYEGLGEIPEAIKQWQYCIKRHAENCALGWGGLYGEKVSLEISQKQLDEMIMRQKWRQGLDKDPVNAHFDAQLVRVAPKVFVAKGTLDMIGPPDFVLKTGAHTWRLMDGSRVEIRIQDAGYKMPNLGSFSMSSINLDPHTTILQDAISVREHGEFQRKLDMSQDKEMYSFTAPKYTVTFWFNPSNTSDTPPNIQDRIGWLGEGLANQKYLVTSGYLPGDAKLPVPGLRYLMKTMTVSREDLIGRGEMVLQ